MTTPRIEEKRGFYTEQEEIAQKIQDLYFSLGATIDIGSWEKTVELVTQAHQAGIDEAVERVNRKLSSTIGAVKMGVISQEQGYNEIIKTLQDNK